MRSKTGRRSWRGAATGLAIVPLMIASLAACGGDGGGPSGAAGSCDNPRAELTIPYLGDTTGPAAPFANDVTVAAQVALAEADKELGDRLPRVSINQVDGQLDPAQGVTNYRKVIEDDPLLIMGSFSAPAAAVAPLANREEVPFVVGTSSVTDIATKNRPWVFNPTSDPAALLKDGIGIWLKREPDIRSVALVQDEKDLSGKVQGNAMRQAVEETRGLRFTRTASFQTGATDFAAIVRSALEGSPDGVMIAAFPADATAAVQEIRRQDPDVKIALSIAAVTGAGFLNNVGSAGEGAFATTVFFAGDPNPAVQEFVAAFKERAGGKPPQVGTVYEAWKLALHAIATADVACKSTKDARIAIRDALATIQVEGVTGDSIRFTKDGILAKRPPVVVELGPNGSLTKVQ